MNLEEGIYKRSVIEKILDYQKSIIIITTIFTILSIIYLLMAQKTYTTDAIVEVSPKANQLTLTVNVQSGESVFARHLRTQIDFLQSRSLIEKVIERLSANVHYFVKDGIRYRRVDDNLPFKITYFKIKDPAFYGEKFSIKAIDNRRYALSLISKKYLFLEKKSKPLIYTFDKLLKTKYFDIAIEKDDRYITKDREIFFQIFKKHKYIDKVLRNLSVIQNSENSSMIKIIYSDTTPKSAKKIVDALIESFLEINTQNELVDAENLLALINQKLENEKEKLDASEEELKKYLENNKIAAMNDQTNQIVNMIYQYELELEKNQLSLKKLQAVQKLYRKSYNIRNIVPLVETLGNPAVSKYVDSILEDQKNYQKIRMRYTQRHPDVQRLQIAIRSKRKALTNMLNELTQNYNIQIKTLKGYISKYKQQLGDIPQKEFGYSRLKRQYDLLEKHYLFLLEKKTQIIISKQVQGDYEYRVIDYAYIPLQHSKPKSKIVLLLAIFFGLIAGVLYALIKDYFSKSIKAPSEVEELTDLPYFGTIPYIKDKKLYNDLFVVKSPHSSASQMMWLLRTVLEQYIPKYHDSKLAPIIAITSIIKGEGKTTIAANLALCLGLGDKKAIVVSMDTRLPELHTRFGVSNDKGITSVLFGSLKLDDVTYKASNANNFFIIPSGPKIDNPLLITNSSRLDEILDELRQKYDYVILDLPPAVVAAESLFLMKKSDLVISVLKAHYSQKRFVTLMEAIAQKHQIKHLGFVLNGVEDKYLKELLHKENIKYIKTHQKIVKSENRSKKSVKKRLTDRLFG